jgi:plastocyanin
MEKKKRIVISIILLLILALIFLLMLFNRLYGGSALFKGKGFEPINQYDLANLDNQTRDQEVVLVPTLAEGVEIKTTKAKSLDYPEPFTQLDFRPDGDSAQQREQIIRIGALGFSPKEVGAVYPAKVVLTFEAIDENEHNIVFEDSSLAYLSFSFSKADGAFTKTFLAPKPGTYNFYVDKEENKGVFKVEAR